MFVKFNPTLGTSTATLRAYNFMRVITAIATSSANSTPVVHPLTAANTYDTNINLITEVIGNSVGGGWSIAEPGEAGNVAHNLPDASYADAGITGRTYRADFWRASGKATYPYVKFTVLPQVQDTWATYPYMDIIYGIHTDTRFNFVAGYAPSGGAGGGTATTGCNLTAPNNNATAYAAHGIRPNETATGVGTALISNQDWFLASTSDYFILIHPGFSITYFGVRELNLWEQQYADNPPIVAFHTPLRAYAAAAVMPRKMMAWWRLKDGSGEVRVAPYLSFYQDLTNTIDGSTPTGGPVASWQRNTVTTTYHNVEYSVSEASAITRISGDPFGGPLFRLKGLQDSYSRIIGNRYVNWQPPPVPAGAQPTATTTPFNIVAYGFGPTGPVYPPIVDPNTGILVPCAYPVNMMISVTSNTISQAYFNQGGRLPGFYKSLSGSDEFMERYYNPGQNFVINNENWYPVVTGTDTLYRDMFLITRVYRIQYERSIKLNGVIDVRKIQPHIGNQYCHIKSLQLYADSYGRCHGICRIYASSKPANCSQYL
jgi:hypothetical protein